MQSFEKVAKNSPCFPSQQENLPSAILFILSTAAAIIMQRRSMEISAMLIHSVVKLNLTHPSDCNLFMKQLVCVIALEIWIISIKLVKLENK